MVIDLFGLSAEDVRSALSRGLSTSFGNREAEAGFKIMREIAAQTGGFSENQEENFAPALREVFTIHRDGRHRPTSRFSVSRRKHHLPDDKLVCNRHATMAYSLGVLSSTISRGLGACAPAAGLASAMTRVTRNRAHSTLSPFPTPPTRSKAKIRASAEELDALRKQRQAENPGLTLTQIYNVLEKLRAGEAAERSRRSHQDQGPRPDRQGIARQAR